MAPTQADAQAPASPSWEDAVEAELHRLAAEVERTSHELLKLGGRMNVIMKEREERQRQERQGHDHAHAQHRR